MAMSDCGASVFCCRCDTSTISQSRKDYEKCIAECETALKIWDGNLKAYYRQTRAYLELDRVTPAFQACCKALAIAPKDSVSTLPCLAS